MSIVSPVVAWLPNPHVLKVKSAACTASHDKLVLGAEACAMTAACVVRIVPCARGKAAGSWTSTVITSWTGHERCATDAATARIVRVEMIGTKFDLWMNRPTELRASQH